MLKPVWVSQAANGRLALWVSTLLSVQSQRHGDPLIQWMGVPQGFPYGPDHIKAALCTTVTYNCSESGALPCPWDMVSFHCHGHVTSQGSRRGVLPSEHFSYAPQLHSVTLGD